jgi:hypothetical protein
MATVGQNTNWLSSKVRSQVSGIVRCCSSNADTWIHPDGIASGNKIGDVPDEPRQWSVFEYADIMEQGLSGGIAQGFIEAPGEEVRLCVERSPDRKEFLLTTNDGERLLLARANDNSEAFSIFVTPGGDPPRAIGPAFTLVPNSKKDRWTLHAKTCDQCERRGKRTCGSRELAYISHSIEKMGTANVCCMEMEIPAFTEDGNLDVWCQVCKGGNLDEQCVELTSRKPTWNPRTKTLNLDFYGRCHLASTRNFQLELAGKKEKHKLLFGKVSDNQFVLDYKSPLGTVQAFAAAISTTVWK